MPKLYFVRRENGELFLYHTAPGADEVHVPDGATFDDVKHLIPEEFEDMAYQQSQPARHPFWDSFVGKFMGGDSGSATWRMVQICIAIWGVYQVAGKITDKVMQLDTTTSKVMQLEHHSDTTRLFERALGSPQDVVGYQSAANLGLRIANKHFPKDVQEFKQQMEWSAGASDFRIQKER